MGGLLTRFLRESLLLLLQEPAVVALEWESFAAVEFEDPLGHVVEKVTVVGDGYNGAGVILQGAFEANQFWAAFAVTGVILGAAYLLWLYQRTMLGQITNKKNLGLADLNLREWAVFLPLMAWALWIGVYPKPYFEILEKPRDKVEGKRVMEMLVKEVEGVE